jgi:hypothetical protein
MPPVTLVWGPIEDEMVCRCCHEERPVYWVSTGPACHYSSPTCQMQYGVEVSWCCGGPLSGDTSHIGTRMCAPCMAGRLISVNAPDVRWVNDSQSYRPGCVRCALPTADSTNIDPVAHLCDSCARSSAGTA